MHIFHSTLLHSYPKSTAKLSNIISMAFTQAKFHSSTVTQPESRERRKKKLQYIFRANREHAVKLQINHFHGKTAHFQPNNLLNFIQTEKEQTFHSDNWCDAMRWNILLFWKLHFSSTREYKIVRNQFRVPFFYYSDNQVTFASATYIEMFYHWNHDQFCWWKNKPMMKSQIRTFSRTFQNLLISDCCKWKLDDVWPNRIF